MAMTAQVLHAGAGRGKVRGMIPIDRREFLKSITLAGAAIFTAPLLDAIEADAVAPRFPGYVMAAYRKDWRTLYAEDDGHGYRLTVGGPASAFEHMTWREVYDINDDDGVVDSLERLEELGLCDRWQNGILDDPCKDAKLLKAYERKGGEPREDGTPLTWGDVLAEVEPDLRDFIEAYADICDIPTKASELDDNCDDWYDRVGPMNTPEGEAYQEVIELLESLEQEDETVAEAARACFEIIEGSSPGNDFHAVYVHTYEDLGILRELLLATGYKVNIKVC